MVTEAFLTKFYRNFYQGLQRGTVPNEAVIKREVERGQRAIGVLESEDFPKGGFLDIGCSAGRVLSDIGEHFGVTDLCGVEPDKKYCEHAKNVNSIDCHEGMFESFPSNREFGLILMMHGLEYMLDLRTTLAKVRSLLCDGGVLYLETPNLTEMRQRMPLERGLLISKLYSFTPDNLTALLKSIGFSKIEFYQNHPIHMQVTCRK